MHVIRVPLIVLCFIILNTVAEAQITAKLIDSQIRLDGVLTEKVWESADVVSDFTQRELSEGEPATERTEVRIVYNEDYLYVGVKCFDSEPDKILHRELKWDTGLNNDDRFIVAFDTYHDKRMGFAFATNANGARDDATFLSDKDPNSQWDGIWEVASRITEYGWSCEFEIPFKTLRFPTTEKQEWGINFIRYIQRKHEEILWRGWRREEGPTHLASAGTIIIPGKINPGHQLDITPYVLAGAEKERTKSADDVVRYGIDLKYGITSNMTLDLTTKTDFAQIESDKDVINLTRYPIQYPEKRDFFLEGLETFEFTQGGTRLFYSRNIGIDPVTREGIPILGGAKLTQKQGGYRLGVMTIQTEDEGGFPSTNYSVVRVRKDVFDQSYIGFIGTSVLDTKDHDNQLAAMDFGYRTDKFMGKRNLDIQGYLAASSDDGLRHDNMAGRIYLSYPNDLINWYGLYHTLDDNFRPGVGFASRVGIKNYIWFLTVSPRPNIPGIKKLVFKPFDINYTTDMDGVLETRNEEIRPLGIQFKSGDNVDFKVWSKYDFVDQTNGWNIFGDTVIPKGTYTWWYYDIQYTGSRNRAVALDFQTNFGDHYSGRRTYYDTSLSFKRTKNIALSADMTYNHITIGNNEFRTREYGGRMGIDFSTRLSSSIFVQWNNRTKEVITNFRIHYIPRVGSDIYIVYNHQLEEEFDYRTKQNAAMLKVNYTYRL
ncbi:MAG: carbohydrate binding family 9 domain-containing protein [Candidatus Latescibacteria bacterium]|nr:carbohydrate binding family 9 domain-containing protein [Candidatus Latescibacterota bacterium]